MGHGRSKLMVSNRFTDKTDSIGFIFYVENSNRSISNLIMVK